MTRKEKKVTIIRLEKSDKIDTASVITGYQETLEGNSAEVFNDYRHYHAGEGGFIWDLCAVDEDGNEYYDKGEEED